LEFMLKNWLTGRIITYYGGFGNWQCCCLGALGLRLR
jgi:hypothetical protein